MSSRLVSVIAIAAALAACSSSGNTPPDSGGPVPDICNDQASATTDPQCELTLGQSEQFYINKAGKQLWLSVAIPAGTDAKSLLHLSAGYAVPSTPVQLGVNLLASNGMQSLAAGTDSHLSGKPQLIDFILPYSAFEDKGSPLLIQCTDAVGQHFDAKSPFGMFVELIPDPDPNTPGTPTPVTFASGGNGVNTGSCNGGACTGVISVSGRVDQFTFTPPTSSSPHDILYLDITAPASTLHPPAAYQLAYTLLDSTGAVVVVDNAQSSFLDVNLATARLIDPVANPPPYTLQVYAFTLPNSTTPPKGDLRLTYTVDLRVMPDVDPQEQGATLPSTYQTATPVPLSAGDLDGAPKTLTGRLSYVADRDWFAVSVPSMPSTATRLHYKITPTNNGGRFASIPPSQPGDRIVEVTNPIAAATPEASQEICFANPATDQCPIDLNASDLAKGLRQAFCNVGDGGALCLFSERMETPGWDQLSNFEGIIPVQPHSGSVIYNLAYQSLEGTYADDKDYILEIWWQSEGAENHNGYHWTFSSAIPFAMTVDNGAASFPDPPAGADMSGAITLGHLYGKDTDPTDTPVDTVYGPSDYDAIPSTIDTYELDFPAGAAATFPFGATWELQWTLSGFSGTAPMALGLAVAFCDGTIAGDAGCNIVSGSPPVGPNGGGSGLGAFAYDTTPANSWYNTNASYTGDLEPLWDMQTSPGTVTITARPYGCFCMENAFLTAGKFYIQVIGLDRKAYQDVQYSLATALTAYPQPFVVDGGSFACPLNVPTADAGCQFANQ